VPHNHSPNEERRIREEALDETIEDSFPASDPPSTLPNPDYDKPPKVDDEDQRDKGDAPRT
jgi:hypothetical protein